MTKQTSLFVGPTSSRQLHIKRPDAACLLPPTCPGIHSQTNSSSQPSRFFPTTTSMPSPGPTNAHTRLACPRSSKYDHLDSFRSHSNSLQRVKIRHFEALEDFLETVPRTYCTHIEELDLCTAHADLLSGPVLPRVRAEAVIALLSATPKLTKLSITMSGSMDKSMLSPFPFLLNLRELSVANCGDDKMNPLCVQPLAARQISDRLSQERAPRSVDGPSYQKSPSPLPRPHFPLQDACRQS